MDYGPIHIGQLPEREARRRSHRSELWLHEIVSGYRVKRSGRLALRMRDADRVLAGASTGWWFGGRSRSSHEKAARLVTSKDVDRREAKMLGKKTESNLCAQSALGEAACGRYRLKGTRVALPAI